MSHWKYGGCETRNTWGSIEAHFRNGAGRVLVSHVHIKMANTSFMTVCNLSPISLPKMEDYELLMLPWPTFAGWHRDLVSPFFDYKGGQYIQKKQWCTIVNILQLTVAYLNAIINRPSQHVELEIGANGSSQMWHNLVVTVYGPRFGLARSSGSGGWMGLESNWAILPIWSRIAGVLARPVALTRGKELEDHVMSKQSYKYRWRRARKIEQLWYLSRSAQRGIWSVTNGSGSGSKPNLWQMCSLGGHSTRTTC